MFTILIGSRYLKLLQGKVFYNMRRKIDADVWRDLHPKLEEERRGEFLRGRGIRRRKDASTCHPSVILKMK